MMLVALVKLAVASAVPLFAANTVVAHKETVRVVLLLHCQQFRVRF